MGGEKQIGWGVNTKLLSTISKQLDQLGKVIYAASGSPVSTTTTTTTVAPYKVYTALLSQSETDAPVATILENTIGTNITWTRIDVGAYLGTASTAFVTEATSMTLSTERSQYAYYYDTIEIFTYNQELGDADGYLNSAVIEIRVYN